MKSFLCALLFLIPALTLGQVGITSTGASFYYVVAGGDTVSQHLTLHRAIQAALNTGHPSPQIVQDYRLRFEVSPWADGEGEVIVVYDTVYVDVPGDTVFVPGDTVYVDRYPEDVDVDTVYVDVPGDTVYVEAPAPYAFLGAVDWEHTLSEDSPQRIVISAETRAIFTDFEYWCDGEPVYFVGAPGEPEHLQVWDEDSPHERFQTRTRSPDDGVARDTLFIDCSQHLQFQVWGYTEVAADGGYRSGYLGNIPIGLLVGGDAPVWHTGDQKEGGTGNTNVPALIAEAPDNVSAGDLLIVAALVRWTGGTGITPPDGWELAAWETDIVTGVGPELSVFYKIADAGDQAQQSYEFGLSNDRAVAYISGRITGADPDDPIGAVSSVSVTDQAEFTVPSIEAGAGSLLASFAGSAASGGGITWQGPAGMDLVVAGDRGGTAALRGWALAVEEFAGGATGPRTWSDNQTAMRNTAVLIEINAAGAGQ